VGLEMLLLVLLLVMALTCRFAEAHCWGNPPVPLLPVPSLLELLMLLCLAAR
jgi:hypothetical protein